MFYVNMSNVDVPSKIGVCDTTDNTTELCTREELYDFKQLGIHIAFLRLNLEDLLDDMTFHVGNTAFCIRGTTLYASNGEQDFDLSGLIHRDNGTKILEVDVHSISDNVVLFQVNLVRDEGGYISGKNYVYLVDMETKGFSCVAQMEDFININSNKMIDLLKDTANNEVVYKFNLQNINIDKELETIKSLYSME